MKLAPPLIFLVSLLLTSQCLAQTGTVAPSSLACLAPADAQGKDLHGFWTAEFADKPGTALLLLEQSREYAEGLSGAINRGGDKAFVAGDVEDGNFSLEESVNGTNITATWNGELVKDSCAKEIRGIWTDSRTQRQSSFVLRKRTGW
jgi:hypothetical protein